MRLAVQALARIGLACDLQRYASPPDEAIGSKSGGLPVPLAGPVGNVSGSMPHPGEHKGDVVLAVLPQRLGHALAGAAEGRVGPGQGGTEFAL